MNFIVILQNQAGKEIAWFDSESEAKSFAASATLKVLQIVSTADSKRY